MMDRPAIDRTLMDRAFAATRAHTNPIYGIALLGLVSQLVHFIRPGGAGGPVERRELAILSAVHPEKEVHHIRLLLPP